MSRLTSRTRVAALLLLVIVPLPLTFIAPRLAVASSDAVVRGVVEDALLRPLAGARVVLHDAAGTTVAEAVTGADGSFRFAGIDFGDYTVEATLAGLIEDHQHVQLSSAGNAPLELVLVDSEEVVSITEDWAVAAPTTATGSVSSLPRARLAELPGAEDRPITDVITTQPGFVADGLGNVYVRGNHANIQYQIDGIPIPDSVGSLFAASIPVRLIQDLEIYTGGMPAEFGDRLGAVVNLTTRQGQDHPDGNLQVRYGSYGTVEPSVTYATKLGKTGVFVGGSYLYSERALDPPSIDPIVHDTGATGRVFARVDRALSTDDRVELFGTVAHNRFEIPIDPSVGPLRQAGEQRPPDEYGNDAPAYVPRDTDATETEDEVFAAASWVHACRCDGRLQLTPFYKYSSGRLFGDATHALGPDADAGSSASDVDRVAHHLGAVVAYSQPWKNHHVKTGAGVDYLLGTTRFVAYQRDDTDGGVDGSRTSRGTDRTQAVTSGVYVQDSWQPGRLTINAGLRLDEVHVILANDTDDAFGISPRLGASYRVSGDLVVHAFTGVNWQPPAPLDAASAARALGVVPADQQVTYDLKPETDLYAETGVDWRARSFLKVGLTGWGRYAYNQLDDTALGSTSLLSNYNFDRGRAGGLEAAGEGRIGNWFSGFGNVSYGFAQGRGISSATYLFSAEDLANDAWQTLDHAQTLTGNLGVTVRDGRFALTSTATYASGLRTGAANTSHVPAHLTVDLASQYTFTPNRMPVRVGVDVENLFDDHYAYRIGNGFVGSSYGAPRSVFVSLSLPLSREPTGE